MAVFLVLALESLAVAQASVDTVAVSDTRSSEDAARRWLAIVDSGRADQSWDSAATALRAQFDRQTWERIVRAARAQVDPLNARRLVSTERLQSLPQVPPGDYLLFHFSSTDRSGAPVLETVALSLESDRLWRVLAYWLRR